MVFMRTRAGLLACLTLALVSVSAYGRAQHTPHPRHGHTPDAFEAPDASVAPTIPFEATFAYESTRTVGEGEDAYEGYTDRLTSAGLYRITGDAERAQIHAEYTWRYDGDPCDEGQELRDVVVDRATRLYEGRTDLDDYDSKPAPLATWLWVPTDTREGEQLQILDRTFTCMGRAEAPSGEVIVLRAVYPENRVDGYGDFLYAIVDEYRFDAATGFFLSEVVTERATGTTEGMSGAFVMRTRTQLTAATYTGSGSVSAPSTVPGCSSRDARPHYDNANSPLLSGDVLGVVVPLAILLIGILLLRNRRKRKRTHDVEAFTGTEITPALKQLTPTFAPFLEHFVDVAKQTGDPVLIAKPLGSQAIVGMGFLDRETKLGTIFTDNGDACEELRRELKTEDFFSEARHDVLPSVRAISATKPAYNVLETYDVLTHALTNAPTYDPDVVTRMKPEDRDAVLALSARVHGVRGQAWFDASLATGDLCFVARIDGQVVGFAMLTVAGDHARLHSNTVHHDFRGRSLGKELTRARMNAAHALGATKLLTEVATWNVASLEVVRSLGFERQSAMFVLTARDTRGEKKALRR